MKRDREIREGKYEPPTHRPELRKRGPQTAPGLFPSRFAAIDEPLRLTHGKRINNRLEMHGWRHLRKGNYYFLRKLSTSPSPAGGSLRCWAKCVTGR
jgi:hypothetical protein